MKKSILKIVLLYFLLSANSFANKCLSENNISIDIQNYTTNGEALSELKILEKDTRNVLFSEEFLGYKVLDRDIKFIDMDFDGKKELIINSDNDPNHSVNYMAIKINCNKVERHPVFGEFGEFKGYDISNEEKKAYIYLDKNNNITTLEYCYSDRLYLCRESSFIGNEVELIRKYDHKGNLLIAGIYSNNHKLEAIVNSKSYLNKKPNISTNIYLIKGDKVDILDQHIDEDEQKWYFINYKGKKDIKMWIKAEAVDINGK